MSCPGVARSEPADRACPGSSERQEGGVRGRGAPVHGVLMGDQTDEPLELIEHERGFCWTVFTPPVVQRRDLLNSLLQQLDRDAHLPPGPTREHAARQSPRRLGAPAQHRAAQSRAGSRRAAAPGTSRPARPDHRGGRTDPLAGSEELEKATRRGQLLLRQGAGRSTFVGKYAGDAEALAALDEFAREPEMHRRHSDDHGR